MIRFITKAKKRKKKPGPKKKAGFPRSNEYVTLHNIADAMSGFLRQNLAGGVARFRDKIDLQEVSKLIAEGKLDQVESIIPWKEMDDAFEGLESVTEKAVASAGVKSIVNFPKVVRPGVNFNLNNPRIQSWMKRHTGELILRIQEETRNSVRRIITEQVIQAKSPLESAKRIKNVIGLTEQQALALEKRRTKLIADGNEGLGLEQKIGKFRNDMIEQRAENIARTETMTAVNQGQKEVWEQAQEDGIIEPESMKTWVVTPDDRLCPICLEMEGKSVLIGDPFYVPGTGQNIDRPPAHPSCRCAMTLEVEI